MTAKLICLSLVLCGPPAFALSLTPDQKLDEKLKLEKNINTIFDFRVESRRKIEGVKGLTDKMRAELIELTTDTYFKIRELDTQSLRLRSVLISDLVNDYDRTEIALIRKRLQNLAERRVAVIIESVESAHKILGPTANEHKEILDDFFRPNLAGMR